jgi:DEAD/DEAH box helicase domain-containing protein
MARPAPALAGMGRRDVVRAFTDRGVTALWTHQRDAANCPSGPARGDRDRHRVGKSLAYQLPILDALPATRGPGRCTSPDQGAGHDQLRTAHALTAAIPALAGIRGGAHAYDGDTPPRSAGSPANGRGGCSPTPT